MISVGLDISAIDPAFKFHAGRGIGRYVVEIYRYLKSVSDPECEVGFFDYHTFEQGGVIDKAISLLPFGKTTIRQHLVNPWRYNVGPLSRFSLLHFPAHMDGPARTSVPYILTVHDLIPLVLRDLYRADKPSWRFRIARWLEVQSIKRATLLLVNSESTANDLVRVLSIPRERIVVTLLGVDPSFFPVAERRKGDRSQVSQEIRARLGIPQGRKIVLYVGGHDERKNIGNIVGITASVIRELVNRGSEPPILVMAGRVSTSLEQKRLEFHLRRYSMERDTVLLGFVSEPDLKELYAESSVFLFPSLYEGFGLPALEAMAAGLPVVASDVAAIPEVVGDTGLLIDPSSVDEGARAVLSILTDSDLAQRLSHAGAARARTYTWERTGRATLDGYKVAQRLAESEPQATKVSPLLPSSRAQGDRSLV